MRLCRNDGFCNAIPSVGYTEGSGSSNGRLESRMAQKPLNLGEDWQVTSMSYEHDKDRIGKIRDGALSMEVGDENDGPITGMVSVVDADLYIVKTRAIYRVFLADEVDPERTNAGIPNGHQRIVGQGSDSEIVARSFLTANVLFNSNNFDGGINLKQVMDTSIVVMKELLAAQKIERELIDEQNAAIAAFQQPKQRSVALPSVEGVHERLKTFIQKVEHAAQAIFKLTQQFYGHTKGMWNGFELEVQKIYGKDDDFAKFARSIRPLMIFVRNLRHGIEHPKDAQRVIVKDFTITPDGTMTRPTVELIHADAAQPEMDMQSFLSQVAGQVLDVFEMLMLHIASKHIKPFGALEKSVGFLPPNQLRPDSKVRVSYFLWINEGWTKLS